MGKRLIDANELKERLYGFCGELPTRMLAFAHGQINCSPTVDAIPVEDIKKYLQSVLDKWEALGERRFEPANMWGYNFIMACFDDLAEYERRSDE